MIMTEKDELLGTWVEESMRNSLASTSVTPVTANDALKIYWEQEGKKRGTETAIIFPSYRVDKLKMCSLSKKQHCY